MRLHYDPISTTSRAVTLFAADAGLDLDLVYVGLANGEHHGEAFRALNPNHQVPVLEDDGFVLTESSAILKYLAEVARSPAYPADVRARARVNERMDWINTGFARDAGYGLAYPVFSPAHRLPSPEAQAAMTHRSRTAVARALDVLDREWIGNHGFLCGDRITIADHLGAAYVSLLELVAWDMTPHPNVERWMRSMRQLPSWPQTYAAFDGLLSALRSQDRRTG